MVQEAITTIKPVPHEIAADQEPQIEEKKDKLPFAIITLLTLSGFFGGYIVIGELGKYTPEVLLQKLLTLFS